MNTSTLVPRPEYPRPQFVRPDWLCLNGEWEFEIDTADTGIERGLRNRPLLGKITVPFCPESELSGVAHTDFLYAVWYRRRVVIPADWNGRQVILHFQAVDYDSTVWVNGVEAGRHRGGFSPFALPLEFIPGTGAGDEIEIVLRARDTPRDSQPRGKQAFDYKNSGCMYTRTTGIWQTVWLEPAPRTFLQRPRLTPDLRRGLIQLEQSVSQVRRGAAVRARLKDSEGMVAEQIAECLHDFSVTLDLVIPSDRRRLWCPEDPFLYDVDIELLDETGKVVDRITSYAGLRGISMVGKTVFLNGKPVFQRLVLDQGYYPDGILTAPSEEALVRDIELGLAAGFNGARLHQKVFEERFLYHADKMGYLIWGEFADWGANVFSPPDDYQQQGATFITEWMEVVERDYSHPSIIGWCPLNETGQRITDRIQTLDGAVRGMFLATKAADRTRPVIDSSGYSHRVAETDIYDYHDYEQDPAKLAENHAGLSENNPPMHMDGKSPSGLPYRGQPYFLSEFGGIRWSPEAAAGGESWGYGDGPKNLDEFYRRFDGLCRVLLDNPDMFGYCYTQLTDVFQEQNGLYNFDRSEKFDMKRIRQAQQRVAAIEKTENLSENL